MSVTVSVSVSGSTPGIMYGLPKVHKDGIPVRPILYVIGTNSYQLAKFLVPILTPLTTNIFAVKDSFTFAKEITTISFDKWCLTVETVKGFSKENLRNMLELFIDTFLIFKSQEHVQEFLSYLNSQHPNMKFTVESTQHPIKTKVSKLVSEFYLQIKLRVIFRTKNTIQNLFKFRDTVLTELKSNIVYKYTCEISIRNHADDTEHPIHRKDFSVLASTPYHQQLLIMVSILTYNSQ
nr:uncharacterized protein LOC113804030 [Penaeus vannamei]